MQSNSIKIQNKLFNNFKLVILRQIIQIIQIHKNQIPIVKNNRKIK